MATISPKNPGPSTQELIRNHSGNPIHTNEKASFRADLMEVLKLFLPLGFIAFGGPTAHIAILHERFVEKHRWLDEDQFLELMAVGQGLPGPTSTQMVVSTGTFKAGILGGLLAFTLWNLPSFIILVLAGLGVRTFFNADEEPAWMSGLAPAAVALVCVASFKLGKKVVNGEPTKLKISLALTSSLVTLLINGDKNINPTNSTWLFPLMLVVGGLAVLAHSHFWPKKDQSSTTGKDSKDGAVSTVLRFDEDQKIEEGANATTGIDIVQESAYKKVNILPIVGAVIAVCWLIGLVLLVTIRRNTDSNNKSGLFALFESFYRIGSIIYGGGQVVLPMLLNEVVDPGWVTKEQFFQGFALVQALPGPLFNFSAYLGCVYKGIPGAFVGWCGLFGPGVALIFAFLPFWERIRQVQWFKTFLIGVNSTAIGLVVAACVLLWQKGIETIGMLMQ